MSELIWSEKYRPATIDDCILPEGLKTILKGHVSKGMIPNVIFSGGPGTGKTTAAKAMIAELGADFMLVNGSLKGNIDTLRNEIESYAATVSFGGGRKYVIVDEADGLTFQTQQALRNFIEHFADNCSFILTCNHVNKLSEAIRSRCPVFEFNIPKDEKSSLLKQALVAVAKILKNEGIQFDSKILVEFVKRNYPDLRKTIGRLQHLAQQTGKIDSEVFKETLDGSIETLMKIVGQKHFTEMRKWVAENEDLSFALLIESIYDQADKWFVKESIPQLVLILAKYDYQAGFVTNTTVNTVACLTEIMSECDFNDV